MYTVLEVLDQTQLMYYKINTVIFVSLSNVLIKKAWFVQDLNY